jgi:hypothetical protein
MPTNFKKAELRLSDISKTDFNDDSVKKTDLEF